MTRPLWNTAWPAALLLALAPAAALAQEAAPPATPAPDDYPPPEEAQPAPDVAPAPLTAIATGVMLPTDRLAMAVTIVNRDDLDRVQGADLTRALNLVPGLTWERTGAPGSTTGVHLRGSDVDDVLVLIDGVRLNDVGAPGGGFDFSTISPAGFDRVEVLRGAGTVPWGSGAVGGIISLTTPEIKDISASAEAGSHSTVVDTFGLGTRNDRYAVGVNAGYVATDGLPSAADDTPGGFHQWQLVGNARVNATPSLRVEAHARYADSRVSGNGFALPPELVGSTPEGLRTQQFSGRASVHYEHGGVWLDGGYALSSTRRVIDSDPLLGDGEAHDEWRGISERADLTAQFKLPAGFVSTWGVDHEWARAFGSIEGEHHVHDTGAHVLLAWNGHVASLTGGVRVDQNGQFGSRTTFSANGSVKLLEGVRLRGGYDGAFRAPSLFQLYSAYGNPQLLPETADSWSGGVDWSHDDGRVRVSISAWRRDSRNLIQLSGCDALLCAALPTGQYQNIGAARAQGIELEANLTPSAHWRIALAISHGQATDRTAGAATFGKDLARRPADVFNGSVDWTSPFKGLVLGADLRLQSHSWDDAANTVRLGAGEVTTLRAALPFGNFLSFTARIENVFDDHQLSNAGYTTFGRGFFAGVKVRY